MSTVTPILMTKDGNDWFAEYDFDGEGYFTIAVGVLDLEVDLEFGTGLGLFYTGGLSIEEAGSGTAIVQAILR